MEDNYSVEVGDDSEKYVNFMTFYLDKDCIISNEINI